MFKKSCLLRVVDLFEIISEQDLMPFVIRSVFIKKKKQNRKKDESPFCEPWTDELMIVYDSDKSTISPEF